MKFRLKADATFEAEDIDDAFEKLAEYFKKLSADPVDLPAFFDTGGATINREDNPK